MKYRVTKISLIYFILICLSCSFAYSQTSPVVQGQILDDTGAPVISATVNVLKDNQRVFTTITDDEGNFSINNLPTGTYTFEVSSIGFLNNTYGPYNVAAGSTVTINESLLRSEGENLEEVIVVGYGTTTRRRTTSSVATVDMERVASIPMQSISDGLQGRVNGVIMTTSSGAPGSKSQISIRGGGEPLFVIDGVIRSRNDYENLNPNDVQDMSILKDAAATAVYGSLAGNGVVVVTTKAGLRGAPQISYSFNQIWSQPTIFPTKLGSYERLSAINDVLKAEGQAGRPDSILQFYKDQSRPYQYPNTDWQKIGLKNFAPEQRHDISYSGGTDMLRVYSSMSYYDQGTILRTENNYNKRLTYRLNTVSKFEKLHLTVRTQLDGFVESNNIPNSSTAGSYGQLFGHIQDKSPVDLAYNEFGLPYNGTTDNPAVELSPLSGYNRGQSRVNNALINFDYAAPFLPGLHIKFNTNYNYWASRNKAWNATAPSYALNSRTAIMGNPPSLRETRGEGSELNLQWFLTYNKSFGDHAVDFTGVYEQNQLWTSNINATRQRYQIIFDQFVAGPTVDQLANGSEREAARMGYVGKLGYNYKNRYFIDFSGRYDGSDYYPPNVRWGFFPSISASYILSDELFMQELRNKNIFNLLKLRGSYGTVGQVRDGFTNFNYIPGYSINNNAWVVNDVLVQGTSEPGTLVSTDYTWYSTRTRNFGLDFASLSNRLNGSIDYFFMRTTGYTGSDQSRYTGTLGVALPPINLPDMAFRREGAEFLLSWRDKIANDFNYKLSATYSYFNTLWENANESEAALKDPYTRTAGVAGGFLGTGYLHDGFFTSNQDLLNGPRRINSVNTVAGDLKYQDVNGDGKIDGNDFRRIGSSTFPRSNYGLTIDLDYKGAFFTTTFAGSGNRDRILGNVIRGNSANGILIYGFQTNYWRPDNQNALYPRQVSTTGVNGNNNYTDSDFWLLRSGYARVKFMQLGYDLKYSLLKNVNTFKQFKVFLSGSNLFTWAKSMDYFIDPESDREGYGYPIQRTISLGANIVF